ncbi:Putative 115 kDa protein in type-1 retrotransposable element R1DM [Eumeta japonica]|uniref:115 kDa protein in type-1 retrotransposable element R1DM n=1 Tax=Eumeta variegata TaxID=151549 RepID=A0A4C2ADA0_EUMVA|nr:Putative 115 kDa protein in type-1 retrotransposable element R1DM [Eumeta japonica]
MQSNLQRSKLATTELLVEAARRKIAVAIVQEPYIGNIGELRRYPGCRVVQKTAPRRGPVKAAIMVLNSDVDVEEDQTLNGENVAAAVIKAGNCRIGVVSVYFEGDMPIGPYLDRVRYVCSKLGTDKIILGGDVNAWSVWGDRLLKSVVDVTACSSALLDRAEEWQVVRDVTSSDHNAVTFAVRVEGRSGPRPLSGTRVYNTAKARWSEFGTAMDAALNERTLTTEMVKSVGSCDQLDEVVETYTECIRQACDAAIPRKSSSTRGLKPPWWSPELEGLKRDARTKKRRIRNAAPGRREYVVGEYVQAREVYERAVAEAQTTSWKRFCSAQDGESLWDGIYRVIRETGKNREDVLLKTDSGQVIGPDESATLLAETFFPDDRVDTDDPYHTEVRRRTDGSSQPPEASGDLPGVDPPFTGAEAAIFRDLGLFLAMANKCLELGYFPRAWKVAAIKVIPKPGKEDYARPKSYRPIGLLPVLGKTVERMLVGRLQWHLMPKLQATQYGFTPQRGTEDALYDLMTHIYQELNLKKIVLMVSLDIEGAFDNAWWPALETQLRALGCPVNLHGLVRGYLRDREVVVKYAGGECRKGTSKGCIQVGFVDRGGGQPRLARVHCWGVRNKLSPSGQGDVGSESGDREDHIHYRDRAYRSVRFVRLGTGDEEARRAKMLDAVQRSVALKACRAHRTVDTFVDRELERPVYFGDLPHPRTCPNRVRERRGPRPQTVDRLAVVGPRIFTDGSRIEGKVGAALTEWRDGRETWYSTLRLDPFCTVFQAEMVALQRAIRRVKNGKDGLVNIFSDSRSSLEVLAGPKTYHPLAHEARRDISEIVAEGRAVRLFWVRAHAGIAGNERADELARRAALTKKTAADYDRFPLSYAKGGTSVPGPPKTEMTSHLAQTLTGHGGFSQYLHRFKLKDSPYCACDPAKIQDVLHVLEECPMFLRERVALETEIGVIVGEFSTIVERRLINR